jgi:hypothetical protein
VSTTFHGRGWSADVGVVLTWLTVEDDQLVIGFHPGGIQDVLPLHEVIDVRVVGRGVGRVPWSRHLVRSTYPNAWANGDTGRALRICRRRGADVYVTVGEPFAAREAIAAAVARVSA